MKTSLGNKENITNNDIKTLISNILGKEIDIPEAGLQRIKDIITFQMDDEVDDLLKKGQYEATNRTDIKRIEATEKELTSQKVSKH